MNKDPIEISFLVDSSEVQEEFREILAGSKTSDEAVAKLNERFKQLTAAQVLGAKGAEDVVGAMKKVKDTAENTKLDEFGLTKENVKIQKQVIKEIEAELKGLHKAIDRAAPGKVQAQMKYEARALGQELKGEKKALDEVEASLKSNKASHELLTTTIRKVKDEMAVMRTEGKQSSKEYKELSKRAIEYQQALDQVNNEVKYLSRGGIQGAVQGLTALAGGFSAVQGAMGLFAGENENLQKIMVRVQSLMAITIGLQQISTALDKRSAFQTKFLAQAKGTLARANVRLATVLGITNSQAMILMGTLTLGLSVAIAGAIILYQRWGSEAAKMAKIQEDLAKKTADAIAEPMIAYKMLQAQWNSLSGDLKDKSKFIAENQDEFKKLGVEVSNVADAESFLVENTDNFIKAMKFRARATAAQQLATEKYKEALEKEAELEALQEKAANGSFLQRWWNGRRLLLQDNSLIGHNAGDEITKLNELFNELIDKAFEFDMLADDAFKSSGLKKYTGNEPEDNFLPIGSVAEIKRRIKEIDDALNKATGDTDVEKLKQNRIKLAEDLAAAEKRIEIQNTKEAIAIREEAWKQYYAFASEFGVEAADKQFEGLKKEAGSFYEWLNQQKDGFADLSEGGAISDKQIDDLNSIIEKMNELSGSQTDFENFTDGIDRALGQAPELVDQLAILEREFKKLQGDDRNIDNGKLSFIVGKQEDVQKQLRSLADAFIHAHQTLEQEKTAITERYAVIRAEIEAREMGEGEQERLLEESHRAETDEIQKLTENEKAKEDIFIRTLKNVTIYTRQELAHRIEALEEYYEVAKKGLTAEQQGVIQSEIDRAKSLRNMSNLSAQENQLLEEKRQLLEKNKKAAKGGITDPKDVERLQQINKELKETSTSRAGEVAEIAGSIANGFQDVAYALEDSNEELADMIANVGDVVGLLANAAGAAASFTAGDVAGGISGAFGVLTGLLSFGSGSREKQRQQREEERKREKEAMQAGLDYNKMLRDRLMIYARIDEMYRSQISVLQSEIDAAGENLDSVLGDVSSIAFDFLNSFINHGGEQTTMWELLGIDPSMDFTGLGLSGVGAFVGNFGYYMDMLAEINAGEPLTGEAADLYEQLLALAGEYGDVEDLIAELEKELKDKLTGTTADAISNSIIEGFKNGKRTVEAFGDDMENILRNAVLAGVSAQVIEPAIQELQDYLFGALEDGVLDEDEAAAFRELYENLIGDALVVMDEINQAGVDIFGGDSGVNSLSGAYQVASQASIDLLSGNTAALRLTVMESHGILSGGFAGLMETSGQMLTVQMDIRNYTEQTAQHTQELYAMKTYLHQIKNALDAPPDTLGPAMGLNWNNQ